MRDLLVVAQPGSEAIGQTMQRLQQAGFQVNCSFDLQNTRAFQSGCSCPHHGTQLCDCQYAVLLVQPPGEAALTLLAHGRDGMTWLSLVENPASGANPQTVERVAEKIRANLRQPAP